VVSAFKDMFRSERDTRIASLMDRCIKICFKIESGSIEQLLGFLKLSICQGRMRRRRRRRRRRISSWSMGFRAER
jgi:hypothetical protein